MVRRGKHCRWPENLILCPCLTRLPNLFCSTPRVYSETAEPAVTENQWRRAGPETLHALTYWWIFKKHTDQLYRFRYMWRGLNVSSRTTSGEHREGLLHIDSSRFGHCRLRARERASEHGCMIVCMWMGHLQGNEYDAEFYFKMTFSFPKEEWKTLNNLRSSF